MSLTGEQMRHCEAAKRLLADDTVQQLLDAIDADAAEQAVVAGDPLERENHRQLVLAIRRFRGHLDTMSQAADADRHAEQMARAME